MSARLEELDWRATPLGDISLRRRWDRVAGKDVYEAKLGDEFLMSSLFTVAEVELARLALAEIRQTRLDVAVGGLGLGYTAQAVLEHPGVRSLVVIEALSEVIEWHERGLVPAAVTLRSDPRCTLIRGDFFAAIRSCAALDPKAPDRRFHAILVDIDHSPRHLLHPSHAEFYTPAGLASLAERLRRGGAFALWSNDPPDGVFTAALADVFTDVQAGIVSFHNPLQGGEAANTVYVARKP